MAIKTKVLPSIVLKEQRITGFAVSPDGERIVFARKEVRKGKYVSHLWLVPSSGGRPHRLTSAEALDGSPSFSPDGGAVLFVSDRSGKPQPWTLSLSGGEPSMLAETPNGTSAAAWSPDGKQVLLVAASGEERYLIGKREEGKEPLGRVISDVLWRYDGVGVMDQADALWTVSARGGKPKRLTGAEHGVHGAAWAPGSKRIAFVSDRTPMAAVRINPQVWTVPASGGTPTRVSPENHIVIQAAWSDAGIAWTGWEGLTTVWQTVGAWARVGRDVIQLAPDRDLFMGPVGYAEVNGADGPSIAWLDRENLVAIASEEGLALPWKLGLDGKAECLAPDVQAGAVLLASAAGRVFVGASVDAQALDIYEVEDGELRPVCKGTGAWFAPHARVPERVTVRRRAPLPDVDGFLVRARGAARRRPLIVRIHGGPYDAFGPVSRFEDLMLADAGYHVLRPNPRGSVSYGEGFAKALHGVWGDPDSEDILALIDKLVRDGVADPERLGVMGLSYGGFMTHWLLANFPGRFKAAVSENPFTDVVADYGAGDSAYDIELGMGLGPWPEGAAGWHARSPIYKIARNDAPLLLLVAEGDLRCPPIHSEIAFTALRMAGKKAEMVRYPGEFHVMYTNARPDRRIDRLERILAWFKEHL
jgi:dipeptidyl aminopeptidase/acylaminoacyl peptidase